MCHLERPFGTLWHMGTWQQQVRRGNTMVQPRISRPWWPKPKEDAQRPAEGSHAPAAGPTPSAARSQIAQPDPLSALYPHASTGTANRNAIRQAAGNAARRAATFSLASAIGVFGSSQIAFAAGTADITEPPALVSPSPDTAAPATGTQGGNAASPDASSEAAGSPTDGSAPADPSTASASEAEDAPASPDGAPTAGGADEASDAEDTGAVAPLALASLEGAEDAEDAEFSALAATPEVTDQASLMGAIESRNMDIKLGASFSIDTPIPLSYGSGLTLTLNGHTLTCSGSAFRVEGGASIYIFGDGSIKAGGSLISGDGRGFIDIAQMSGTIAATTLSTQNADWSFSLMGGTLSLSQPVVMGTDTILSVSQKTELNSVASVAGIQMTASDAELYLDGSLVTTGGGIVMCDGARLSIAGTASVSAGSNAITVGRDCTVSIGSGASLTAGGNVLSAGSSGGAGTIVTSGPSVAMSDGTIASYVASGTIVEFSGGAFTTATAVNPQSRGWYGSIDDIWCPTQADFDGLLAKIPNGSESCVHHTVSFVQDDGSPIGDVIVRKGHCVGDSVTPGAPAAPAVEGKRFSGWKDASGAELSASALAKLPVNADASYVACYVDDIGPGTGDVGAGEGEDAGSDDGLPGNEDGETLGGSNGTGSDSGLPRVPHVPPPATPWNPPGLALAAGFTVPAAGPGVVLLDEIGEPLASGAGAGSGDGEDALEAAMAAMRGASSGAFDRAGDPMDGAAVARMAALALGAAAAVALLARVVGAFSAGSGAAGIFRSASRTRRRKALGLK